MRQYRNLQWSSWLSSTSSFITSNLSTPLSLESSEATLEPSSFKAQALEDSTSFYFSALFLRSLPFSALFLRFNLYSCSACPFAYFSLLVPLAWLLLRLILLAGLRRWDFLESSSFLEEARGSLKLLRLTKFLRFSSKNSYFCILVLLSTAHNLLSRNLIWADNLCFSGTEKGIVVSFLISSFSLRHYQGVRPTSSSQYITPTAKMSLSGLYIFLRRDSMGIQRGVPTFCLVRTCCVVRMEKPKSAIFQVLSLRSTLAGFRSLCTIPMLIRYLVPSITSDMMEPARSSASLPFRERSCSRSPPLQSSVTMQVCECARCEWQSLMTLGWLRLFSIQISFSSISSPEAENLFISITFTAYCSLSLPLALYTRLLYPAPIQSDKRQEYSPTDTQSSQKRCTEHSSLFVEPPQRSFLGSSGDSLRWRQGNWSGEQRR